MRLTKREMKKWEYTFNFMLIVFCVTVIVAITDWIFDWTYPLMYRLIVLKII